MRRLIFTAILATVAILGIKSFAAPAAGSEQCDESATEIPIVAQEFSEGVRACKYADGWHLLNNAGEQILIVQDKICVKTAGKGNQLCCPQTNTGATVEAKNSRFENKKGSRFECHKDSQGKEDGHIIVSRVDDNGNVVKGSDTFDVSGSLDDAKDSNGKPQKNRKSHMTIRQVQGGTGSGSNPKDGQMELNSDIGKSTASPDETCDSTVKCKTTNLIEKEISLDDKTHKYVDNGTKGNGKPIQSDRNGELQFSADANR